MAQYQRVVVSCCFTAATTAIIVYLVAVSTNRRSANSRSTKRGSSVANTSQDNGEYEPYPEVGSFPWEPTSKDHKAILSSSEQERSRRDEIEFLSSMTFASYSSLRKPSCPCCT
jgi:hypothetical protein